VVNPDPVDRLCVSVRFNNIGWDQALDLISREFGKL